MCLQKWRSLSMCVFSFVDMTSSLLSGLSDNAGTGHMSMWIMTQSYQLEPVSSWDLWFLFSSWFPHFELIYVYLPETICLFSKMCDGQTLPLCLYCLKDEHDTFKYLEIVPKDEAEWYSSTIFPLISFNFSIMSNKKAVCSMCILKIPSQVFLQLTRMWQENV